MRRSSFTPRPWAVLLVGALGLTGAGGCGPRTHPVEGRVAYPDGAPVKAGRVVFEPADPGAKTSARGEIQADGTFRLGTYQDADGAVEGRYRALVFPPPPADARENRPPPPLIHPRYRSLDTSPLEYTVTRGKNEFTLVVERP